MIKRAYTNSHDLRPHYAQFFEDQGYTHFLTLNSERALSIRKIRSIFSTFCFEVDRKILGAVRVTKRLSNERLRAVAFPEHLETNAHLHCLVDLTPLITKFPDEDQCEIFLQNLWRRVSRTQGSLDLQPRTSAGAASYSLKASNRKDPTYFLSSDFHRN
jgi:hypothetical protein